ncbi:MAG: amidohydrolase [Thiohalospira sp.]
MQNNLHISCIQTELFWEDVEQNLKHFELLFNQLSKSAELVILPEMFTTGFSMKTEKLAEKMNGKSFVWLKKQAAKINKIIIGSIIIKDQREYFNRLFVMFPDGNYEYYDKRHLFRMGNEHKHYSAGKQRLIFNYKNWRICPLTCYDLRFPVWSRNQNDYDLLIYLANWPESRREVWKKLLPARAIENQVYVAGVNRIGNDGEGLSYAGDTMIISPKGVIMNETKERKEQIIDANLSLDELNRFREKFPVGLDADKFKIL